MTVAITRLAMLAADLRSVAAQTQDAKAARRILAIALVLEGWSREAGAEACAMDRQTLRDGYDAILEACCDAWNKLMQMTERIASLTRRNWAKTGGRIGRLV
jgi:hypothetical protein